MPIPTLTVSQLFVGEQKLFPLIAPNTRELLAPTDAKAPMAVALDKLLLRTFGWLPMRVLLLPERLVLPVL